MLLLECRDDADDRVVGRVVLGGGRAIQRDGRVALCVDDERRPYAYVMIEGRARVTEDHDEVLAWSIRLASRYVGDGRVGTSVPASQAKAFEKGVPIQALDVEERDPRPAYPGHEMEAESTGISRVRH
ncbi:MAG: hypothetical protein ACR2H2_04730 [Solirubrobacteraceae bacterium]